MKAKILIVAVSLVIVSACSKDKFNTKPKLTFESINGSRFVAGQNLIIKLRLTDKEGDFLLDSSDGLIKQPLFYKRVSFVCPANPDDTIPTTYGIPSFSGRKDLDAFLDVSFTYGITDGQFSYLSRCADQKNDSLYFRFWIKDDAGNVSDTVNTPVFTLVKE